MVMRLRLNASEMILTKKWNIKSGKKADEAYRKSGFGVVAIIGAIICGIIAMGEFSQLRYSSRLLIDAIISALQTILFVSSVLFRKGVIKSPTQSLPTILTLAGLILIIPFVVFAY